MRIMGKRITSKITLLLLTLALVIAFVSCTPTSQDLVLCCVRLDDSQSRAISSSISTTLNNNNLYYKAVYKGNGQSYGSTNSYVAYNSSEGILLSQGKWEILCQWKDSSNNVIASGTTREIWINLNTTSLLVYLDGTHQGTAQISYSATWRNSSNTNPLVYTASYRSLSENTFHDITLPANINLDSGRYMLIVKVYDKVVSSSKLVYTDSYSFVIKDAHTTILTGSAIVDKAPDVVIPWEPDPTNPDPENGNIVNVNQDPGSNGNGNFELDNEVLENNTIYIANEDTNGSGKMELGHSDGSNGNRIVTPVVAPGETENNFAIDMNGTDIVVSTDSISENTTIVLLNENITMNIFNSDNKSAEWGEFQSSTGTNTRYHANVKVNGGNLNIIGAGDSFGKSSGPIVFTGPESQNNILGGLIFKKQGAINMEGTGGKVLIDGDVTVQGVRGISSCRENSTSSSLSGEVDIDITLRNSTIVATGRNIWGSDETSYGIYLQGNNLNAKEINIVLDGATINTSNSRSDEESCIRIDNFNGTINIELKNGASLTSAKGNGIFINNCSGTVNLTINNSSITASNNDLNISSSTVNVNVNGTPSTRTSSVKNLV